MLDVGGKVPHTLEIFYLLLVTEEASHLPLKPAPAMVGGGGGGGEEDGNFSGTESLGDWKAEETGRREEERRNPLPSYRQ